MAGFIYSITQVSTGKRYIGLTTDYLRRKSEHLSDLRHSRHCNQHLQNTWNKYSESDFKFEVLQEIEGNQEDLKQAEIRLIDELGTVNSNLGFNISRGGDTAKWRAINQYTKEGILVGTYDTMSIAALKLGKLSTPIWKALNGIIPSAHGYQWRYCDSIQDVRDSIGDHALKGVVEQRDLQGNLIREFGSAMDAARSILHLTKAKSYKSVAINIRKACYGQAKQYLGFSWNLKE